MAYDPVLATRLRAILHDEPECVEKRMFGGIAFLLRGNLCVAIWKDSLVARVGPDAYDSALREPHTQVFDVTGAGDTVVVPAGVHREHVTLDRTVRLVGRPGAILDGGGEGTVLRITAPGVEVRGLTIRASGAGYTSEDAGIRIDGAPDARVIDVHIEDTLFGIFVVQSDRCLVDGSTIVGKDLPHVRRGDGIRLWYSAGCRLHANRVERSRDVII